MPNQPLRSQKRANPQVNGELTSEELTILRARIMANGGAVILSFFDGGGVLAWALINVLKVPIRKYISVECDDDAHNALLANVPELKGKIVRVDDVRSTADIQKAIGKDVVDVFCSGSPCNGTAGRNHARATSKSVYEHPLSGLVKYVQKWHRILKKAQRGSPYVTVLENVEAGVPIPQ